MKTEYYAYLVDKLAHCADLDRKKIQLSFLFGYIGIFYEQILFGAFYKNQFYLKSTPRLMALFADPKKLSLAQGFLAKTLDYVHVPKHLWQNAFDFKECVHQTLDQEQHKKQTSPKKLHDLPNISLSLERALYKIGLHSCEQFKASCPFELFYQLEKNAAHQSLSETLLFHLYAAQQNIHVLCLTALQKQTLLTQYTDFLKEKSASLNL